MASTFRPPIDLGFIIAGPMDSVDQSAMDLAIGNVDSQLNSWLPGFDWKLQRLNRDEWRSGRVAEPTDLLLLAQSERDIRGLDLVWVITASELLSHYKSTCHAAIANSLDATVISTSRIDPRSNDPSATAGQRIETLSKRISVLVLHALGHWCRLDHVDEEYNIMFNIESPDDFDMVSQFSPSQIERMNLFLEAIADQRLEERKGFARTWKPLFYLRAIKENRGEIIDAIVRARPWQFPFRLGRLTTAAVSTMLVLIMTAETWDMASKQSISVVLGLIACTLTLTTGYVAVRQQLILSDGKRNPTEQIVASNVSAAAIVGVGMSVTFGLLFVLTLTACWLLFPIEVVEEWTVAVEEPLRIRHYIQLAAIVGSLGIVIGALGASFEEQHHFRHVVLVDEEI